MNIRHTYAAGAIIMHVGEARDQRRIMGEATFVVTVGVGHRLGHSEGEGSAREDMAYTVSLIWPYHGVDSYSGSSP